MIKKIGIFLIMLLTPYIVCASKVEPEYEVTDVYMAADIDMLGSMHIKEAIVVKGTLNGFTREINFANENLEHCEVGNIDFRGCSFYNARGISLASVSATKIQEDEIGWSLLTNLYPKFEEDNQATLGANSKYQKTDSNIGMEVSAFNVNKEGYMVYIFDYYINQAVVLHEDVAELYYTFFTLDVDVKNKVNIQVTTPGQSTSEVFRFWAHGTLTGEIAGISDKTTDAGEPLYRGVLATIDNYQAGQMLDIRMTFDRTHFSSIASILNSSEQIAFDEIIEIEQELAAAANSQRVFVKIKYYMISGLSILYIIGIIIIWIYIYRKYAKEYNVNFDHKYYREFTGDYNVEVVDYLINNTVTTKAFSASIMNLIYKKNIRIEERAGKKNKKEIFLYLVNRDNINSSETILVDLLFNDIGNGECVSLKSVEKYSSKFATAENFKRKYDSWIMSVEREARKEEFFEKHTRIRTIAILYFVFGMIIFIMNLFFNIGNYITIFLIVIGSIAFLIYSLTFKKWTRKGREHYLKWQAFKNFLKDFGSFKDKEIPEIALWDKYLVYATVFGIAKEVQKAMKIVLVENNIDSSTIPGTTLYRYDYHTINSINTSFNNAYSKSTTTINAHTASSHMSSGSGFGGGFSGGGGFAGGGGGGSGF